jgi:hypothetical protein
VQHRGDLPHDNPKHAAAERHDRHRGQSLLRRRSCDIAEADGRQNREGKIKRVDVLRAIGRFLYVQRNQCVCVQRSIGGRGAGRVTCV